MSKYTTEVRFICETEYNASESKGYNDIEKIVSTVHNKIFDFEYPIFDTEYKKTLETKILKHYYTREIGEETVGLWKLRLNAKMNEIMPYYNQLYQSTLLKIEPFVTHNVIREHEGSENGTTSNHDGTVSRTDGNSLEYNLYSDTPQGALNGVDSEKYLTNATKNTSQNGASTSSTTDGNSTIASTDKYLEKVVGFEGINQSKLLSEYRKTFLNIDMQIIEELEVLFMQLW